MLWQIGWLGFDQESDVASFVEEMEILVPGYPFVGDEEDIVSVQC
jgi:hypothetical protein